jgi:O-antigen/teichoic acid export membrane protein
VSALQVLKDKVSERLLGSGGSSSWALLGQVGAALAGLANFLLLARLLGPATYGGIAGALALVLTIGPISAVGADKLVIRDIAREPQDAPRLLTYALATVMTGAAITTAVLILLHPVVLPQVALLLLVALALAEILGNSVSICVVGSWFAVGRGRAAGLSMLMSSSAKIVAVVIFALTDGTDPVRWALLYSGLSLLAAAVQLGWAFSAFGRPSLAGYRPLARAREGAPYSANVASTIAQNDVDKTILVRAGFSEQAGLYAVAYRLATMAWLPVLAVLQATQPRFFAIGGKGGVSATAAFAQQLFKPLAAYGVFAAVVLLAVAPLVPLVVGEEYRGSVTLLMLLAPLALLKVSQYVPSEALTGANRQSTRTACIAASMVVNVTIGIIFIPRYGVAAALVGTFISEVLYAALVTLAVRRAVTREEAQVSADPEGEP